MKFSYEAYRALIGLLKEKGYDFCGYHDDYADRRCVILRHDIDTSIPQALNMAELEAKEGVSSTYFVLLRTDFYNPASAACAAMLRQMAAMGHEIGLHFDELAYADDTEDTPTRIRREAAILSDILQSPVRSVSMHRPSAKTLESNYEIEGLVNSYGELYFKNFKYLSDSRHNWREPVTDIVRSGEYERLHILTHPFWYHETDTDMRSCLLDFIRKAGPERYDSLTDNIRDLTSVLQRDEI